MAETIYADQVTNISIHGGVDFDTYIIDSKLAIVAELTCHRNLEPVIAGGWLGCRHGCDVAT